MTILYTIKVKKWDGLYWYVIYYWFCAETEEMEGESNGHIVSHCSGDVMVQTPHTPQATLHPAFQLSSSLSSC